MNKYSTVPGTMQTQPGFYASVIRETGYMGNMPHLVTSPYFFE